MNTTTQFDLTALEAAQKSFLEQYDERIGYEYRAAYRRGYDYLWVRLLPTSMGTAVQFTHADEPCQRVMLHLKVYAVDAATAEKITEQMSNKYKYKK